MRRSFLRLPIVRSPDGEFYTPAIPEEEKLGRLMASVMLDKIKFTFQKVSIRRSRFFPLDFWYLEDEIQEVIDDLSLMGTGWRILAGRPYQMPKSITPKHARWRATSMYYP